MRAFTHRSSLVALSVILLMLVAVGPAAAQTAEAARGSAFGVHLTGPVEIGPEPAVEAAVPPGEEDEDTLIEVPLDPLVFSGTATVEAQAATQPQYQAVLQDVIEAFATAELPQLWNARGYAITENLVALDGNLTADVLEAEALASCVDGNLTLASGSRILNATLAGQTDPITGALIDAIPITSPEPNFSVAPEVLGPLGVEIVTWDTNWDGATGTLDGSDTVYVNALRVSIAEDSPLAPVLGGPQDLVVSHAEATADCGLRENPLRNVSKTASEDTVSPGDTFEYTITIPNADANCTLDPVRVEDVIQGPAGSTIAYTDPTADSVQGLTVIWENVGPIAPGETVVLTIGVTVPNDAPDGAEYSEALNVTAQCDGEPVAGGVDFLGPIVRAGADLPTTGGPATLAALALMVFGASLRWLRS